MKKLLAHLRNILKNSIVYFQQLLLKIISGVIKKPINHKPFSKKHVVASKLPAIFAQNGGIFIRLKKDMIKDGRFVGNKPYIFTVNEIEGWDLDHPWQLEVARTLVQFKYAK